MPGCLAISSFPTDVCQWGFRSCVNFNGQGYTQLDGKSRISEKFNAEQVLI